MSIDIVMERKIRVLHITPDDKFFDFVYPLWETVPMFANRAALFPDQHVHRSCDLKYIKNRDSVTVFDSKGDFISFLVAGDYDVVFFHSLLPKYYDLLASVPQEKVVIWWAWGVDLYQYSGAYAPLIKLDRYKPLTQQFIRSSVLGMKMLGKKWLSSLLQYRHRRELRMVLQRIDYFQPVVREEFLYMRQIEPFHAKEFYYKREGLPYESSVCRKEGDILLCHSAVPDDNHLDVYEAVKKYRNDGQRMIMPLGYGKSEYRKWLLSKIHDSNVHPLIDFLPSQEYFKILNGCSYAVFGSIRQMALGNVSYVLSKGIKVFLYKESMNYKNLKGLGYAVYAIEEMNEESFSTPLTKEELEQNKRAASLELERKNSVFNSFINDMKSRFFYIQ